MTTHPTDNARELMDLMDALEELAMWLRLNDGPRSEQVMKARAIIAATKKENDGCNI